MSATVQEWLVYGIVALAAGLLLRGYLRRRRACENCPIQKLGRASRISSEPRPQTDVGSRARSGPDDKRRDER
ncbi:MAG: hypothetical protein H6807_10430 [Planctomycetes bacterium]|nr:hypothetical protein [Planctomycetota bacterium]